MIYSDEDKKKRAALNQREYPSPLRESGKNVPGGLNLSKKVDSAIGKVKDSIVGGYRNLESTKPYSPQIETDFIRKRAENIAKGKAVLEKRKAVLEKQKKDAIAVVGFGVGRDLQKEIPGYEPYVQSTQDKNQLRVGLGISDRLERTRLRSYQTPNDDGKAQSFHTNVFGVTPESPESNFSKQYGIKNNANFVRGATGDVAIQQADGSFTKSKTIDNRIAKARATTNRINNNPQYLREVEAAKRSRAANQENRSREKYNSMKKEADKIRKKAQGAKYSNQRESLMNQAAAVEDRYFKEYGTQTDKNVRYATDTDAATKASKREADAINNQANRDASAAKSSIVKTAKVQKSQLGNVNVENRVLNGVQQDVYTFEGMGSYPLNQKQAQFMQYLASTSEGMQLSPMELYRYMMDQIGSGQ